MRGIVNAESVSDHSFGVAFIALVLAQQVDGPIDTAKLLTMALLHDLPEAILSDIPSPAASHLPAAAKRMAEQDVLGDLLDGFPDADSWQAWWREYEDRTSIEGQLVRDADRLDMLLQAYVYEQTRGNRWLDEFWEESSRDTFACDAARSLFDALCEARKQVGETA